MSDLLTEIRAEFDRLPDRSAPRIHRVARDFYPWIKKLSVADRDRLCTDLFASRRHEEGALVCISIDGLRSSAERASLQCSPDG